MSLSGDHGSIDLPKIGVADYTMPIDPWQALPRLLGQLDPPSPSRRLRESLHPIPTRARLFADSACEVMIFGN
jgi:hypothetical protein